MTIAGGSQVPPAGQGGAVLVAGATGYIGRFVVRELLSRGYRVICLAREPRGVDASVVREAVRNQLPSGIDLHFSDVCDPQALSSLDYGGAPLAAVVSCLASRSGGIEDAWAVEYRANCNLLALAQRAGAGHFVLLSAICVQKPLLAFQQAKLAFETRLQQCGLRYSIVRPTAFFKSLAGQVEAVQSGKPFTVFGDGELTACKPISEADLSRFVADCLIDPARWDRLLPVGGPGEAVSPRQQGEMLFRLCGRRPRFRRVPLGVFDLAIPALSALARLRPALADKAEFARIGRYYASESMLLLNPETGAYDAAATPSWGADTLEDFYRRVLREGMAGQELGQHKLF
jgi:divinyl chlorophyllide a 8-vinyl-reductase